jgi:tRNA(fMet)-specific endonuclease VapC
MKPVSESIKFAIDTNIVSAFFKGEPDIGARMREAQQVYLPIIVLAELYFGAEKSPVPPIRSGNVNRLTASCLWLKCCRLPHKQLASMA